MTQLDQYQHSIPSLTDEDIFYVSNLAREAGQLAIRMREGVAIKEKSGPQDMVTAADIAVSELIVERLKKRFPSDLIISEEDQDHSSNDRDKDKRLWLVDPIDGTDSYIANSGQYSVQIGLIVDGKAIFGWVFAPTSKILYFGAPIFGAWRQIEERKPERINNPPKLDLNSKVRLMMSGRDRSSHPWVKDNPQINFVKTASIGLKVAMILENNAEIFAHLSGTLKTWDTAGPIAIALGGELEAGSVDGKNVVFSHSSILHNHSIVIGKQGSLQWSAKHLIKPPSTACKT